MALHTDSTIQKNPKNRCRICLEATNGKIELNQTIHYEESGILLMELLEFCVNEQVYENGKADGVCLDCLEKGMVNYEFNKRFKISQGVLLKELEGNNGFSFEIKVEEDFEEGSFAIVSENIVIKHEILEEDEMEQIKENPNECKMALPTDSNKLESPKNRCRICLEATNGKIELNQTIHYKETGILLSELLEICVNEQVYENGRADGVCLDCMEKGMVCYEFKRRFKVSQGILLKEMEEDNGFSFEIKVEEDFEDGRFIVEAEYVVIKNEILEEEETEQVKENPNECELTTTETDKPTTKIDKHTCEYCGKSLSNAGYLVIHKRIHTGEKPFSCKECGMTFNRVTNLQSHKRIHTGEKPYSCKECGRSFAHPSALKVHQVVHTKQKDHLCQICGATFARAVYLRRHVQIHSTERPSYKCTICKKDFRSNKGKDEHMITHTGERNHACEFCGKRFNRTSSLNVHRKIHTGETPHICKVCRRGFRQSQHLRQHMKTQHKTK